MTRAGTFHVHVGNRGSGKTTRCFTRALESGGTLLCMGTRIGKEIELPSGTVVKLPAMTLDEWVKDGGGRAHRRARLTSPPAEVVDYLLEANASAAVYDAVVMDEAQAVAEELGKDRVLRLVRESRHTDADWYWSSTDLGGLPSTFQGMVDTIALGRSQLHKLFTHETRRLAWMMAMCEWPAPDERGGWPDELAGLSSEELTATLPDYLTRLEMGHSAVLFDLQGARVYWLA